MSKHALLIGIDYLHTDHALEGPIHDVFKIKKTLIDYDTVVMTDLTELKPTKENIVTEFKRLLQQTGQLFFYYSGHGIESQGILCADSEVLTTEEFRSYLEGMNPASTLVSIVDTCFSGNLFDLTYHWANEWVHYGKPETPGHVFLISSSQDDELSFERMISGNMGGVFTDAYLKGIKHPQTWRSLMEDLTLAKQTPELSTGQPENVDGKVII